MLMNSQLRHATRHVTLLPADHRSGADTPSPSPGFFIVFEPTPPRPQAHRSNGLDWCPGNSQILKRGRPRKGTLQGRRTTYAGQTAIAERNYWEQRSRLKALLSEMLTPSFDSSSRCWRRTCRTRVLCIDAKYQDVRCTEVQDGKTVGCKG